MVIKRHEADLSQLRCSGLQPMPAGGEPAIDLDQRHQVSQGQCGCVAPQRDGNVVESPMVAMPAQRHAAADADGLG